MITKYFIIRHLVIIYILSNISACSSHHKACMNNLQQFEKQVRYKKGNNNDQDNEKTPLIPGKSTSQQEKSEQKGFTLTPKEKSQGKCATIGAAAGTIAGVVLFPFCPPVIIPGMMVIGTWLGLGAESLHNNGNQSNKPQQEALNKQD